MLVAFRSVLCRHRGRGQVGSNGARQECLQGTGVNGAWKVSHGKVRGCSCCGAGDFRGVKSGRQGRENSKEATINKQKVQEEMMKISQRLWERPGGSNQDSKDA